MKHIFFDIETSDLHYIGQILDYAFVEVDDNWNICSTLRGKIKLSRLQLPNPGSIVATGIDIIRHNEEAEDLEHVAMAKILKYLQTIVEREETKLIGYNSSKFDLPYIRTSFIRNGLNPYFAGAIKYGDLIHVVQKLVASNPDFYSKLPKKDSGKPSTKLEAVSKAFGLLDAEQVQDHESYSDVLLTIKLAKHVADNYGVDVRYYSAYEALDPSTKVVRGYPYVDKNNVADHDDYSYYALLEQNKAQALWVNIKDFEDGRGRDAVNWYNKNTSSFFVKEVVTDESWKARAEKAVSEYKGITLNTFWPKKVCDVEQFIYMLPMNEIDAVYDAIWRKDLTLIKQMRSKYGSQLYLRFLCNISTIEDVENQIKEYALYRYGGKLKLGKDHLVGNYEDPFEYYPTYKLMLAQLEETAKDEKYSHIMNQLRKCYENSAIFTIAGKELMDE
jgi:hypothetical protein